LEGIPSDLQSRLNVRDNEEVVFVRLMTSTSNYAVYRGPPSRWSLACSLPPFGATKAAIDFICRLEPIHAWIVDEFTKGGLHEELVSNNGFPCSRCSR